jgi:hypothetical protein
MVAQLDDLPEPQGGGQLQRNRGDPAAAGQHDRLLSTSCMTPSTQSVIT